jgi:hypothetical protein
MGDVVDLGGVVHGRFSVCLAPGGALGVSPEARMTSQVIDFWVLGHEDGAISGADDAG